MSEDIIRDLKSVAVCIGALENDVASLGGQEALLSKQNAENEAKVEEIKKSRELFKKSSILVSVAGEQVRENIKTGFEDIVTHALRSIVGEEYNLKVVFAKRGNMQETHMNVCTPDFSEAFDPLDCRGGGIVDIVSLVLRVAMLELCQPKIHGPLILDEPFKHLSKEYIQNASVFLAELVNKMGRQVICVTHVTSLANESGNVIQI